MNATHRPPTGAGWPLAVGLCALAGLLAVVGVTIGPHPGSFGDCLTALVGGDGDATLAMAVRDVRLPRSLQSVLLGAALALAGLLSRTAANNRLATPSVLGVHNGANLGLLAALVLAPQLGELGIVGASFAGALAATLLVLALASLPNVRRDPVRWLLVGVLLNRFEGGLATAILFAHGMQNAMLGWTVGRLVQVDWLQVALLAPALLLCVALSLFVVHGLDTLRLGEHVARGLGVRVGALRALTVGIIVLLAGAATAVAGPVAYVGLVVPNLITRRLLPNAHARLLACAAGGAVATGAADALARLSSGDREVPLGLWTMLVGAAFFLAATMRRRIGATA